jgi:hypothetical protein
VSQFSKSNPKIEMLEDGRSFLLLEPYEYYLTEPGGETITVPAGYVTDFASVPKLFWTFGIDPFGKPARAALIHDFLYSYAGSCKTPPYTKKEADRIFYDAMGVLGVNGFKRWIMWKAVQAGGKGAWK